MAKNKVSEWSSTPVNNTDVGGIDIAEGCAPSGINNAIREMMAQIKDQQAGTDADNFTVGGNLVVTGTTTLTGTPTAPTATAGTNTTQIATTAFVAAAIYPVGSIYTSTVATNPATLLGFGTWVAFGEGRVLIGNGGGFSAGATGGSADAVIVSHTHTFSGDALPSHTHTYGTSSARLVQSGSATPCWYGDSTATSGATSAGTPTGTNSTTGSSGTNANLQPYIVVYMWNRTA